MEDRDSFFHPLSPSCFKQISSFKGLSYAVQNQQHDIETSDKGKESRVVRSSSSPSIDRRDLGMVVVVSAGRHYKKPL